MEMTYISMQICLALSILCCISSSRADEPTYDIGPIGDCSDVGELCVLNSECCSSCCTCGFCLISCEYDDNPCNGVDCGMGTCILEEAACSEFPCEPNPVCIPANSTNNCATEECGAGYYCKPQIVDCIQAPCPLVGWCVPGDDPCSTVKCPSDTRCVIEPNRSKAVAITACEPILTGCKSQ